jgi:signal transduction histidine kinase/CheY-like chemotaxis protein
MTAPDDQTESSYLGEAETALEALRRQEVDAVVGDSQVLLLRLQEAENKVRESEKRLRELNKTLEQRIAERTAKLEQQAQELRQLTHELTDAEQRERKRLARILHDGLQQILMAVEITLTMLGMDNESEELEQARELVSEAVQISRSLAYELAPPVLYESTFTEALAWLARWFGEKHHFNVNVNIATDLPTLTENAKVFLFNAIRELLLNSVKHSGVQEAVVHCAKGGDDWWQIEVQDAGKGFNPVNLNTAYLHDEADIERGFGLLSIRERLISLGGSLEITSEPDTGAHFMIRFPVSAAEPDKSQPRTKARHEEADAPDLAARREGRSVRILVVDDHRVVREALAAMLQRQTHFEVIGEAGDGAEAVELAEQLKPDVILMDITMPHMNGIEATRRIKEKHPTIYIVGLSLHDEADKAQAMRRAGATTYLQKETASKTLIETLMNL